MQPPAPVSCSLSQAEPAVGLKLSEFGGSCGNQRASQVSMERCRTAWSHGTQHSADVISLGPSEYLT